MSGFCIEKVVKKGLSDEDVLKEAGFINIADGYDGRKTASKDRRIYGGISITTKDMEGEDATAVITYATVQNPLYNVDPATIVVKTQKFTPRKHVS